MPVTLLGANVNGKANFMARMWQAVQNIDVNICEGKTERNLTL